jgi:hypothetical protein
MATENVTALKAHLAINVKNVERSVEFYRKCLALSPLKCDKGTRSLTRIISH